jgi:hypothetical protein
MPKKPSGAWRRVPGGVTLRLAIGAWVFDPTRTGRDEEGLQTSGGARDAERPSGRTCWENRWSASWMRAAEGRGFGLSLHGRSPGEAQEWHTVRATCPAGRMNPGEVTRKPRRGTAGGNVGNTRTDGTDSLLEEGPEDGPRRLQRYRTLQERASVTSG